eukprot:scaffold11206_cov117-Isochrysis_galbana.AAC.21
MSTSSSSSRSCRGAIVALHALAEFYFFFSGWLSGVAEAFGVALWLTMLPCAGSRGCFGDEWISMTMSVGPEAEGRRSNARVSGQQSRFGKQARCKHSKRDARRRASCCVPTSTPGLSPLTSASKRRALSTSTASPRPASQPM